MDITKTPPEVVMEYTRKGLAAHRGRLSDLAQAADVPHHTLLKIRQGVTLNPRLATISPILRCLHNFREYGDFVPPDESAPESPPAPIPRRARRSQTAKA